MDFKNLDLDPNLDPLLKFSKNLAKILKRIIVTNLRKLNGIFLVGGWFNVV